MVDRVTLPLVQESLRPREAGVGRAGPGRRLDGPAFSDLLEQEVRSVGLRFSNHALERMRAREIDLDPDQRARVERAIDAAHQKGARNTLILVDGLALVVGIQTRTVITAIDADHRRSNVFTNIDSAVIA